MAQTISTHKATFCSLLNKDLLLQDAYDREYKTMKDLEQTLGVTLFEISSDSLKELQKNCSKLSIGETRKLIKSHLIANKKKGKLL